MTKQFDVLLTGAYFCDMVFNGLPEMPQLGRDVFSSSFDMVAGGVFYTAQALQRLGVRAGWLCDVGNDLFSRFIIESAEAEGIDTSLFRHHERPLRRIAAAFSFAHDRGFVSYMDELPDTLPLGRNRTVPTPLFVPAPYRLLANITGAGRFAAAAGNAGLYGLPGYDADLRDARFDRGAGLRGCVCPE